MTTIIILLLVCGVLSMICSIWSMVLGNRAYRHMTEYNLSLLEIRRELYSHVGRMLGQVERTVDSRTITKN